MIVVRWSSRVMVLAIVVVAGAGIFIMQKYAFSLQTPRQLALQRRVEKLREEGVQARLHGQEEVSPPDAQSPSGTKIILMHSFPPWYELFSGPGSFASCNHSCTLTLDGELVEEVDSVVIYSHHFKSYAYSSRAQHQMWVYFAVESPFNSFSDIFGHPQWSNRFNWTMTYRRDSDFYFGYGDIHRLPQTAPVKDFSPIVKNKTKMVAWFVSNCHTQSKREDFVSALKEFVSVDVYGACGDLKCDKSGIESCMSMLSRDYYFYLAFENSMCQDYITEKLYRTMRAADIVPVVRGGGNYTAVLPADSFIDASRFPSVKALAEHLRKVAGDSKLYEQHLAWKNKFKVIEPMPFPFCDMCYKLHHADRWANVHPSIQTWWHHDTCHDPPPVIKS